MTREFKDFESCRLRLLQPLHIPYAGNFAHAGHDSLQVLQVGDVGDQFHGSVVFGRLGFDVLDVSVGVADDGGDLFQHAGAVVAGDGQLDRVARLPNGGSGIAAPLDGNAALGLEHEVFYV